MAALSTTDLAAQRTRFGGATASVRKRGRLVAPAPAGEELHTDPTWPSECERLARLNATPDYLPSSGGPPIGAWPMEG